MDPRSLIAALFGLNTGYETRTPDWADHSFMAQGFINGTIGHGNIQAIREPFADTANFIAATSGAAMSVAGAARYAPMMWAERELLKAEFVALSGDGVSLAGDALYRTQVVMRSLKGYLSGSQSQYLLNTGSTALTSANGYSGVSISGAANLWAEYVAIGGMEIQMARYTALETARRGAQLLGTQQTIEYVTK